MTTITDEPINLPQALAAEIARVSALRQDYLDLPRNAGAFAAACMASSIANAVTASGAGDVIAMLAALRDRQHFTH